MNPSHGHPVNVSECVRLYGTGLSIAEVGRRLGHHHSVIHYHLIRNGVQIRTQGENRRMQIPSEKIGSMYLSGMSAVEIAKELEVTYQCVYDRLAEIGIKTRSRSEQIKAMKERGLYKVPKGKDHKNWNGGVTVDRWGYRSVNINGEYILEHRYVWENARGKIPPNWIIHHLNGEKQDNRLENLAAMPRKQHSPAKIIDPFRKRIRDLEAQIKALKSQRSLFSN